jgi:hypothetical protein
MARFTISHHTGARESDHYDLMIEQGEVLRTWRVPALTFAIPQAARQIKDHRKVYLDYEGEIEGKRGHVKIWDTGVYAVEEWTAQRIRIAIVGRQIKARLLLERAADHPEDAEPRWTIVDAALPLRKAAAGFLRSDGLGDAPTPELADLRVALSHEEQKILALVDQYSRGGAVEWSLVETDPELRRRIGSEGARWRHPWFSEAKTFADKIDELARLLTKHRPTGGSS